jgi:hypothetical protein
MKNAWNIFITILAIVLIAGCSSMTLTVNSVPEKAKVFVRPVGGGELTEVGVTPAVIGADKLKSAGGDSGPIIVEIHKDEFVVEKVLVTETSAADMKLDFALRLLDDQQGQGPGKGMEDAQNLNQAIDRLFEVRKFISLESYSQALGHLKLIEEKWPYLSATYEMKGGILFLQKKYRDALAAYSLAIKYNPASVSSSQMQESLEKQLGIDGEAVAKEYEMNRLPLGKIDVAGKKGKLNNKNAKKVKPLKRKPASKRSK